MSRNTKQTEGENTVTLINDNNIRYIYIYYISTCYDDKKTDNNRKCVTKIYVNSNVLL